MEKLNINILESEDDDYYLNEDWEESYLNELYEECTPNSYSKINMRNNSITHIPKAYLKANMLSLVRIDLAKNCIKNVPAEICLLQNLKYLDLSNNCLEEFPSIWCLNLTHLDFGENQIQIVPEEIGRMTKLEVLKLQKNLIKSLPPEIGHCVNLIELNLRNNCLEELPSIWCLNLTHLDVGGNQIQIVPEEIGRMTKLVVLKLQKNLIRSLPPEIGHSVNLNQLNLHYNKFLQSLPETITRLRKLKFLFAERCSLLYLPFFEPISMSTKCSNIFRNPYLTHVPVQYWNMFTKYYNRLLKSTSCNTTPSCCYTIIEKNTNRYIRLCPRTRKVFCCFRSEQNAHSLFELCLRSIHNWSKTGIQFDIACLPTTLRDYVKNGPITGCVYSNSCSLLFSEYFLLIFTMRGEFVTAPFCSRICGKKWITKINEQKKYIYISPICDWESC